MTRIPSPRLASGPLQRAASAAALLFSLAVAGCGGAQAPECAYESDCGERAICDAGVCREVDCVTHGDCVPGQYCTDDHTCEAGCSNDLDCPAGSTCDEDAHSCVPYGCRNTQLDCALGERCDKETGTCKKDNRPHCRACDAGAIANTCGTDNATCFVWNVDDTRGCSNDNHCADGWMCDYFDAFSQYCHQDRCLMKCNPDAPNSCPRGFDCVQGLDSTQPNVAYCYADCNYLTENGFY